MGFELRVVDGPAMTDIDDVEVVALRFMENIGYIMRHYDPKTPAESVRRSVPYRLFLDCFLRSQDAEWRVEDLSGELETSVPTIYRHMTKLRNLGIVDEDPGDEGKVFHLKHYSFPLAWSITEANVEAALRRHRSIVEHIQGGLKGGRKEKGTRVPSSPESFSIRIRSAGPYLGEELDDVLYEFLEDLGYISEQGTGKGTGKGGIAYRMVRECFLDRPDRFWDVDELRTRLDTTRPTVYRHLNKLEATGLTERKTVGKTTPPKKAHRIRYGNMERAWNYVEEYTRVALENYRKTVDHMQVLLEKG